MTNQELEEIKNTYLNSEISTTHYYVEKLLREVEKLRGIIKMSIDDPEFLESLGIE